MLPTVFWSVVATGIAGLLIKFWLEKKNLEAEITWREYGIGMLVTLFCVAPLVAFIGFKIAESNNSTFTEFWNGWELSAEREDVKCTRDGSCYHDYDCDSYSVYVDDGDGEGHYETRYHDCPYTTVESSYLVQTTLGEYFIDSHRLPENPQQYRWKSSKSVPQWVIEQAGTGAHPFWSTVKQRIDANSPGPVSQVKEYENYVLASERTILKQYSAEVLRFQKAGLLPLIKKEVKERYVAEKVYFVGHKPKDKERWNRELNYLNAAFGTELQGDAYLVIVENSVISGNPDEYAFALKAYWEDRQFFDKDCLSKNGVVIIVGTDDGARVSWARAFTGMPLGNEMMTVALRSKLKDAELSPEKIIGTVRGEFYVDDKGKKRVRGKHTDGAIENVLWGLEDPTTKFARVSMSAKDSGDEGTGYLYLRGEIQPTNTQRVFITLFVFAASCMVWAIAAANGERTRKKH